ncbi:c-type cytochrome [Conexibacter sp. SYSU D00693]|uniref:c-type cytochrome n=1 Tax=Conexibacter sp. SYSU D00693 TaxID=2812560 RepID=UPI00196B2CB3|nr:c-type cytochrome [Conexibacter sp. SYSU D00693]
MSRRPLVALAVVAVSVPLAACSSNPPQELPQGESAMVKQGQQLFQRNCTMCHTMDAAGGEGSATKIRDRERPDGPNFDVRKETVDSVLYAIRNGGYSGAIMPENIVVGREADAVAAFVAKYAGRGKADEGGNPADEGDLSSQVGGNG